MAVLKTKKSKGDVFIHPNAYHIWTDGSFRPPDNASCAYLILSGKTKTILKISKFAYRGKTINQMELEAINKALDYPNMDHVVIYSDSSYAISCLSLWRKAWAKKGWLNPLGEPIKNKELIQEIGDKLDSKKFYRFVKVKAHSGEHYNTLVDYLATSLSKEMMKDSSICTREYVVR